MNCGILNNIRQINNIYAYPMTTAYMIYNYALHIHLQVTSENVYVAMWLNYLYNLIWISAHAINVQYTLCTCTLKYCVHEITNKNTTMFVCDLAQTKIY